MSNPPPISPPAPLPRRALLHRVQEWAVILTLLATVAGWLGDLWWVFDLGNHFRVQYVLLLALLAVTTLISRQWTAAFFVGIGLVINSIVVAPLFSPAVENVVLSQDQPPLHVVAFNLHTANRRFEDVAAFIADSGAHIVLVQEIDAEWDAALRARLTGYRMAFASPREDNFGIGVLVHRSAEGGPAGASLEVDLARELDVSDGVAQVPTIELTGRYRGRAFALLGLHALPPVRASVAQARDAQLAGAAIWANRQRKAGVPAIILGDLNATPWCVPFRRLIADANLENSLDGRGLQGTWHATLPGLLRIPIDHCLHTPELVVHKRTVGPDGLGSDHLPVSAWIEWRR